LHSQRPFILRHWRMRRNDFIVCRLDAVPSASQFPQVTRQPAGVCVVRP
jgi:hypothetical protein